MNHGKENPLLRLDSTLRLVLLSVLLGVVGALGAQFFLWLLRISGSLLLTGIAGITLPTPEEAHRGTISLLWTDRRWLIPLVTGLGGLLSGLLVYRLAPETEGHGTDAVVRSFHREGASIRTRVPFVKALASAVTIGSGGSAGREGPIVQIGAGIGSILGRTLRLPDEERRDLLLVGMSAGLAAVFKSPLGSAIFAIEILYSSMAFEYRTLLYTVIGASIAYTVTGFMENWQPLFYLPAGLTMSRPIEVFWYLLLGILSGIVGTLLPWAFYSIRDRFHSLPLPSAIKPAIGGVLMGGMAVALPQLLAGGYGWIQMGIDGKIALSLMAVLALGKILALSLTVSSGGSGGVFAPSLYTGAMVGGILASLLPGSDVAGFTVVGMAALFAGSARILIAPLIMVIEMTGGYHLIMPAMISVSVSYAVQAVLSRKLKYRSLYEAQVPLPVNSPAHYERYYSAVAAMLRQRQISLEDDIIAGEMGDRLSRGRPVPLPNGHECLYAVDLKAGSTISGRALKEIRLPHDVLIVGLLRKQDAILPHGDTILLPNDHLLVAATEEAMDEFRRMTVPNAAQSV